MLTDEVLLRLEHIDRSFGPVQALTDVSLDIPAGCLVVIHMVRRRRLVDADRLHGAPRVARVG